MSTWDGVLCTHCTLHEMTSITKHNLTPSTTNSSDGRSRSQRGQERHRIRTVHLQLHCDGFVAETLPPNLSSYALEAATC